MTNKNFCPISSQMWITQGGGGYRLANNKFVATNLSHKTPNFCSKNLPQNQTISKAKTSKFSLNNQSFLNTKLNTNFIANRYFSNLTNINLDNCLLNNQVKHNISNTYFSNLKSINLHFSNTKHYIKNLLYNLIKLRHTISGLFRVYTRFYTKLLYSQFNLSKIPKNNRLIKWFLPKLQE